MLLLAVAVVVSLIALVVLAARVPDDHGFGWDARIVDVLADAAPVSDGEVHVDPFVAAGTLGLSGLAAVVVLILLVRRQMRAALFLAGGIGGAVLLSSLVKGAVDRAAIEGEDGASFPSGTATWSMAVAATGVLLARGRLERIAFALAGATLVLLLGAVIAWEEWHYPSDVLAGWCLAVAWVGALFLLLRPSTNGSGRRINARADTHATARHQPPATSDG